MKILQEALNSELERVPKSLLADLFSEKLTAQGVRMSRRQCERLAQHAIDENIESFDLPWWRFWQYRRLRKPKSLLVEFTSEDADKINVALEDFSKNELPKIIEKAIDELPERILGTLQGHWKSEFKRELRQERGFRRRHQARWAVPISQLRMLLRMASEFGAEINDDLRTSDAWEETRLADVLTRLHARACHIASEVEYLLSGGFSDGAMARWRSLHEVAVVALFVSKHGAQCAERYTHHEIVESKKAANNYARCHARLGCEPMPRAELEEIERSYQFVLERYGARFCEQYGWARPFLSIPKRAPRFSDIEEAAGIAHLRGHYQMASHNVHANPKGLFFKLGLLADTDVLLIGPSNAGLADPGHASAISLIQASVALVTIDMTLDNIVAVKMMMRLADQIGASFLAANRQLVRDEERVRDQINDEEAE